MKKLIQLFALLLLLGGCEALEKAKAERRAKEAEEIEESYQKLDALYEALRAVEASHVACDDDVIEETGKGRYARSRRRLPAFSLHHLGRLLGHEDAADLSWGAWRSRDIDEIPSPSEVGEKNQHMVSSELKRLMEGRYVIVYRSATDEDSVDFDGTLFVVDLEEGASACQVKLESEPSRVRVGPKQSTESVRLKAFESDVDKALKEITEHFEVGY